LITDIAPRAVSDLAAKAAETRKDKDTSKSAQVEREPSRAWFWWTLGGVAVVGGGAATAVLLMSNDATSTSVPNAQPSNVGSFEVKWK